MKCYLLLVMTMDAMKDATKVAPMIPYATKGMLYQDDSLPQLQCCIILHVRSTDSRFDAEGN